ncbi:MAG: BA14K family protein [Hyphomicrobiales bacterium]
MISSKRSKLAIIAATAAFAMAGAINSAEASRYCDREARAYADSRHSSGEAAVASGLGSAAVGAIIGGIAGGGRGAGRGAAIGGVAGAFGGAIGSSAHWRRAYDWAYERCLDEAQQPARYAPAQAYAPPEGSQEWIEYCTAKYKSFDPQTGMYLAYSGKYRRCR